MSATKPSIPARRFSRFERIKVEPPRFLGCARIRNETRVIPFSFHSTYILDSLPYGHSAFRKGFPVKFIQAEIYGILVHVPALYMKLRFCPFKALCHTSFFYNLP
ncbi:hypothetical protein TWF102_001446 [Orbilia oligospora]|uniref:Uncharacterized protein n=1 Tax=Orbilia oligospora TaxID=2813651 RepID=A0A7C8N8E8_ORBOL|nr:hypothetical protein TWF102_001446 [Orbilia oligospora]